MLCFTVVGVSVQPSIGLNIPDLSKLPSFLQSIAQKWGPSFCGENIVLGVFNRKEINAPLIKQWAKHVAPAKMEKQGDVDNCGLHLVNIIPTDNTGDQVKLVLYFSNPDVTKAFKNKIFQIGGNINSTSTNNTSLKPKTQTQRSRSKSPINQKQNNYFSMLH